MLAQIIALIFFICYFTDSMPKPELLIAGAVMWLAGCKRSIVINNAIADEDKN